MQGRGVVVDRGVDPALAAELMHDGARGLPAQGHAGAHDLGKLLVEGCEHCRLQLDHVPDRGRCAEGLSGGREDRLQCLAPRLGRPGLVLQPLRGGREGQCLGDEGEECAAAVGDGVNRARGDVRGSSDIAT